MFQHPLMPSSGSWVLLWWFKTRSQGHCLRQSSLVLILYV